MPKLSDMEIQDKLKNLKGWSVENGQLHKLYTLKDFKEAMAFVVRVALIAEPMDHHPDIDIRYKRVTINLSTHSEGGITDKDFTQAAEIDAV